MNPAQIAKLFEKHVFATIDADMRSVNVKIAQFIDQNVIDRKFDEGFPGHELTPDYVRAKQRAGYPARVGERTGALRQAATKVTNWSLWQPAVGKLAPLAIKQRRGLTAYAEMVKTKTGGEIDFLRPDAGDAVNIQAQLFRLLGPNYKRKGAIRLYDK